MAQRVLSSLPLQLLSDGKYGIFNKLTTSLRFTSQRYLHRPYSTARNASVLRICVDERILNKNSMHYESRRYKGHSHWQNIARTKQANDMMKSNIISRSMIKLRRAVWQNNGERNPKFNKELANVLAECAANNVPKDTINRTFDRIASMPPAQVHPFDICGRSGIFVVAEIETANKNKTKNQLLKICAKLADFGVTDRAPGEGFQEVGIVKVFKNPSATGEGSPDASAETDTKAPTAPMELSDAETLAIEVECEEVREIQEDTGDGTHVMFEFTCAPSMVDRVASGLRVRGCSVQSADIDYVPNPGPVKVSPALQQSVKNLYTQLEQFEGVGRIFDNIDWEED